MKGRTGVAAMAQRSAEAWRLEEADRAGIPYDLEVRHGMSSQSLFREDARTLHTLLGLWLEKQVQVGSRVRLEPNVPESVKEHHGTGPGTVVKLIGGGHPEYPPLALVRWDWSGLREEVSVGSLDLVREECEECGEHLPTTWSNALGRVCRDCFRAYQDGTLDD